MLLIGIVFRVALFLVMPRLRRWRRRRSRRSIRSRRRPIMLRRYTECMQLARQRAAEGAADGGEVEGRGRRAGRAPLRGDRDVRGRQVRAGGDAARGDRARHGQRAAGPARRAAGAGGPGLDGSQPGRECGGGAEPGARPQAARRRPVGRSRPELCRHARLAARHLRLRPRAASSSPTRSRSRCCARRPGAMPAIRRKALADADRALHDRARPFRGAARAWLRPAGARRPQRRPAPISPRS